MKKNKLQWGNILLERKVFRKLSHIVPAIIIYYLSSTFLTYKELIEKGAIAYLIIVILMVVNSLLNAITDIYQTFDISKVRPIKGYVQVIKIIVITLGGHLVIANLLGSPLFFLIDWCFLSGIDVGI